MSLIAQLEADVRALATPAGRQVGTAGHAAAREFLVARMHALGLEPYAGEGFELPYRGRFTNILGVRRGTNPSLEPLLVAAHYDTCGPLPGADDNAAALAIALATAAELAQAPLARSVVFAFFDSEEPPHFHEPEMGSNHFYAHQRRERIHFALVMDLVGHDVPIAALEDLLVATGLGRVQGSVALVRAGLDVRAPIQQLGRDLEVAEQARPEQGRGAVLVVQLELGPMIEEFPDHGHVPIRGRGHERRPALRIGGIRVSSMLEQQPGQLLIAARTRDVQRRRTRRLARVRSSRGLEQETRDVGTAHPDGNVQWRESVR